MSSDGSPFLEGMLRNIQATVARTEERLGFIEKRMGAIEERMVSLERRQTASTHFEQAVLAHLAAIHEGGDNATVDMRATKRSVDELLGDMRLVKHRLDELETR